jgi:hypothetical protein
LKKPIWNLVQAQKFSERSLDYQSVAKELIKDITNCSDDADAQDRLMNSIKSLMFFLGVNMSDDATQLILNSDAFLDNLSPVDRNALSTYARNLMRIAENVRIEYSYQLDNLTISDISAFTRSSQVDWGNGYMGYVLNVSYLEACENDNLKIFLYDGYDHATYQVLQAKNLSLFSRELLKDLGEDIDVNNSISLKK